MNRPSTDLDDAALLVVYRDGADVTQRDEAFALLVARHGAMVAATCRRWLSGGEAEDAVQAVFVVLARKAGDIRVGAALPGWLHQTAWNIAQRAASAARARRIHETRAAQEAATMPSHAAAPVRQESDLDAALVRLPETYRTPLVLHYLEGLPQAEVAQRLGLRENAVAMRLSRGRTMLRAYLERFGAPATALGLFLAVAPPLSSAESTGLGQMAAAVRNGAVPGRVEALTAGATASVAAGAAASGVALLVGALAASALAVGAWLAFPATPGTVSAAAPIAAAVPATAIPGEWERQLAGRTKNVLADADGRVWTTEDAFIHAFAPDGTPIATLPNPDRWYVLGPAGPQSRLLLLGKRSGGDSLLCAVDARTGAEVWRRSWALAADAFGSWIPEVAPVADGSIIVLVATGPSGPAHLLRLEPDGREAWSRTLNNRTFSSRLVADASGAICCGWTDGRIDVWSQEGSERWNAQLEGTVIGIALLADGSIVVGSHRNPDALLRLQAIDDAEATRRMDNGLLTCFGPDGAVRWKLTLTSGPFAVAEHPLGVIYSATLLSVDSSTWDKPPRADDTVVSGWCALVGADGVQRWRHDLRGPGDGVRVHADGSVTVAGGDGRLTCLGAHGDVLAQRDLGRNLRGALADRHGRTILLSTPRDEGGNSRLIVLPDGWWRQGAQGARDF